MKATRIEKKGDIKLGEADARVRGRHKTGVALAKACDVQQERIVNLQRVLYADGRHALLIVLQGRDASGKDGTIRKVFSAVNPQGCSVSSFVAPTDEELRHDFLWRVHRQVPPKRMIGIFNRSHYEDVLVPRVHGTIRKRVWKDRYRQINDFERMLSQNGVTILKFMLHVSREEQGRRLRERLEDESKNWKFNVHDLDDRARWDEFTEAYADLLDATSTKWAPWYVIPADDKDIRDLLISRVIADTLDDLDLRYPEVDAAVRDLEIK